MEQQQKIVSDLQNQVSQLQDKIDSLEGDLRSKDGELTRLRDTEKTRDNVRLPDTTVKGLH